MCYSRTNQILKYQYWLRVKQNTYIKMCTPEYIGYYPGFNWYSDTIYTTKHRFGDVIQQLLATGSMDRTVKLWDLSNNKPSCIASHNPKAVRTNQQQNLLFPPILTWSLICSYDSKLFDITQGRIFSIAFSPDNYFLIAIGGSRGKLKFWDTLSDTNVSRRYGSSRVWSWECNEACDLVIRLEYTQPKFWSFFLSLGLFLFFLCNG